MYWGLYYHLCNTDHRGNKAEKSPGASWKLLQGCSELVQSSFCLSCHGHMQGATFMLRVSLVLWLLSIHVLFPSIRGGTGIFPTFRPKHQSPKQQDAKIKLKKATPLLFCSFTLSTSSSLGSSPEAAPLPWGERHRRMVQVEKMGMRGAESHSFATPSFHSRDSSRAMGLV